MILIGSIRESATRFNTGGFLNERGDTMSKWLYFEDISDQYPGRKTSTIKVLSAHNKDTLGWISWFPQWMHYCFSPVVDTVFSDRCMVDIAEEIRELERHRTVKAVK